MPANMAALRARTTFLHGCRPTEPSGCRQCFLGDSRYDHEAAVDTGMEFVFGHSCTELAQWQQYCEERRVPVERALQD